MVAFYGKIPNKIGLVKKDHENERSIPYSIKEERQTTYLLSAF
jgi:hypothetical protein